MVAASSPPSERSSGRRSAVTADAQTDELSVLVRHVPQIVVSRFVAKPEPLRGPESSSFLAAVALFDISGFSSLGSRLSEDEHRQHVKSGSVGPVVLAAACSPTAAAHANPPPFSNNSNSGGSSSNLQLGEPKTKSRMSLPSLAGVFDGRSGSSMSAASRRESTAMRSPVKPDDREGPGEEEEEEDVGPGGSLRRRQSAVPHSSGTMSFTHGAKPTAVPQGTAVEALTTTLNKSLEPVIDVILKHGGDIIKFAGDALIVLWETEATRGTSTPAGELVHRAVCCALEALQALEAAVMANNDEHEHLDALLGMHVGLGVSEMTGNHVGGVLNRWEFYLSGDANRQMSFAEANAQTGQLALSPEAYAALEAEFQATRGRPLSEELHVTPHKSGNCIVHGAREGPALETPRALASPPIATTDLIPFLHGYVPGPIVSHLERGLMLTSCRLNITVAFVKLDGVVEMPDPQLQLQSIHQAMCSLQECAYKAQGTLRQFVIDDKGAIAIIALGLPPFYHENNALRGVKFACYVLERGIKASIGVTTGSAFCGSVGSSARAEYAVVGDSINLAARLMAAAPVGDIYCDERTYEDTKASLSYRGPVEMTVKGKIAQVRVFPVQRLPQSTEASSSTQHASESSYPAPFGCSDVLDAMPLFGSTAIQNNSSGSEARRALIVSGDSGTGKSMLLEHVMHHQHARCFKGGGDPVDTGVSFHAWRGIAKAMAGVKVKLSQGRSVDSTSVVASATSSFTALDTSNSSLTTHRASHHGRPSRTSTLPTFSEDWSDRELSTDNSSRAILDNSNVGQMESVARSPHHLPVLEYLELQQQVTKAMLATLRDWFPYDDAKSLPSSGEISPSLASPEGEDQEKTLKHVLLSMVAAVSAVKPILLVFDDVQWMDDRSLSLVRQMIEELPNVFFLLAVRNIPLRTASVKSLLLGLVASLPGVTTRPLSCFSYQDTSLFLCQRFHIAIMDSKVLEFVFARTEGNPAALIKLVTFMLDAQYVDFNAEGGSISILKDLDEMDTLVPQHMRARVMSVVHSLDALAQTTLKLLSINPQPTEERMINGVLTLLAARNSDISSQELNAVMLKMPEIPLLQQVRSSLAACEKTLLTLDAHNKLYFFNSEEMRLVVYDTMLPSQRTALHALFAEWLRGVSDRHTSPAFAQIGSKRSNSSLSRIASAQSTRSARSARSVRSTRGDRIPRPLPFQQYALLGYHHSRSDDVKAALEAYHLAGERALEAKELGFAEDCMHSSYRILNTHPRVSELSELDFILLRSRIEFIGGVIAVANSDWDLAVNHMSYITRLFHRKGSVLRRYTASIRVDGFTRSLANYSSRTSITPDVPKASKPGCGPPLGPLVDSIAGLTPRPDRCLPRLFAFNDIYPSVFRSAARPKRSSPTVASIPPRLGCRVGANRIQPEQTLQTLNQIHFYRRKASKLIKQINRSKKKQEEMHRQIQQLAQKSLETKDKR